MNNWTEWESTKADFIIGYNDGGWRSLPTLKFSKNFNLNTKHGKQRNYQRRKRQ